MRGRCPHSIDPVTVDAFSLSEACATLSPRDHMVYTQGSMNPTYPGLLAAALYLVGGVLQFKTLFRQAGPPTATIAMIAVPAVVLHGIAALWLVRGAGGFDLGVFPMLAVTTFIIAFVVVVGAIRLPLQSLYVLVFPFCAAALLAVTLFAERAAPVLLGEGLALHVLLSIGAYTVLAVAACQGVVLQLQERNLRIRRSFAMTRVLPPLETMEGLLFHLIWLGFVLLTASIVSGFVYLEDMFAKHVAHHTVLTLGSWIAFGTLLIGRHTLGWRSTTAVRFTIVGFALLVLGYLGSKVVKEIILQA